MNKELYIIRHGETDLNKQGIVQGRGINSDLNETGRMQAQLFYKMYKDIPFDKIYTSSLKRTHQTVKDFIAMGIPWEQHSGLDELAWGALEGKESTEQTIHKFKDLAAQWQAGAYDVKIENGESPAEAAIRLNEVIDLIKSGKEEKLILICMHGRVLRLFLCLLTGVPLCQMADFPHQNTTLYKVTLTGDKFAITSFNNTDHLNSYQLGKD